MQALNFAGRVLHRNNQPPVLRLPQADGRDFLTLQVGMVVLGGSGMIPDTDCQLCGNLPAGLFGFIVRSDGPDAFMQGLAFGSGQFLFRPVCPRSLIAGAPVLPPDGSRNVQKRLVRAVLAVGPVRCAATVQEAIGLNGLDLQPSCTQTLGKTVQNVRTHHGLPTERNELSDIGFTVAQALNKLPDIFNAPSCGARAKLHRLGITTGSAALPPGAFANGDAGQNLGQTDKAEFGE